MDIQLQSVPGRLASAITDAFDSQETQIPNEGITQDTVLTLSGTGTVNSVVFIFDNQTLLRTASVIATGNWTLTTTVLLGRHAFTVRDELAGADSLPYVITVNEAELDLREPTVTQAPGGTLNPVDAISGAMVVVTYDMLPTDTIGLSWNGLDDLVSPQPGNAIGSVTFTIPASAVAAVIGKDIPVQYGVMRNGVPKPSKVLPLKVQTLPESALEAPRILQAAADGSLDVAALTGDADLRVKPWPFIEAGQRISLRFEGTKADGTAYNWAHPTWQDLPIGSTGEPSTTVALSDLKELKDGSSLTLIFEVSFSENVKVFFPKVAYTLIVQYFRVENFDLVPIQGIAVGQSIETPVMTLTFWSGTGVVSISRYPDGVSDSPAPQPGKMEGNTLAMSHAHADEQLLVITPKAPCSRISFYYLWTEKTTLRFYDQSGRLMTERYLNQPVYSITYFEISFLERIGKMEIFSPKDWAVYDNFSFQD